METEALEGPRASRLGNPLAWRTAERCVAIALLMVGSTAIVLLATLAGGWPFLPFPGDQAPALWA